MEKPETIRINLNMPIELLTRLDNYATNMNINRTSAICVLINTALESRKAMNDLSKLLELYQQSDNEKK